MHPHVEFVIMECPRWLEPTEYPLTLVIAILDNDNGNDDDDDDDDHGSDDMIITLTMSSRADDTNHQLINLLSISY